MGIPINFEASNMSKNDPKWTPVKLPNGDTMYTKENTVKPKPTGISAKIICDSTNWLDKRLTTFVLEYPRYIHAELMTHRVFSKNSASSRAIPIEKMIGMVMENGVIPKWTQNKAGMQGNIITDQEKIDRATNIWLKIKSQIINAVFDLSFAGIHKQNANRLLEPFQYIRIVLTGTEFDNWFALRDHEAAHPEIRDLAKAMRKAYDESLPIFLEPDEWHIPFGDQIDRSKLFNIVLKRNVMGFGSDDEIEDAMLDATLKISVARCARVSYNTFDGEMDYEKDLELYKKLVESEPLHASPAEHQAKVPTKADLWGGTLNCGYEHIGEDKFEYRRGKYFSNLVGWVQLRKVIENLKYAKGV